jgi:hypothetical protein
MLNTPAKPTLRIMKMMKGGNQKKLMRQMEAMKSKGGGMGGMPGF